MTSEPMALVGGVPEPAAGSSAGGSADVLTLNVGGERLVATLRGTLTVAPGSKLSETFSGRWDASLPRDRDGNFFIDRRPEIFLPLLDFLRTLSATTTPGVGDEAPPLTPTFDHPIDEQSFRRMVDALDLTNVLYNYEIYLHNNSFKLYQAERTLVSRQCSVLDFALTRHPDPADDSTYYSLDRARCAVGECHGRRVTAFEIRLGREFVGSIGWIARYQVLHIKERPSDRLSHPIVLDAAKNLLQYADYNGLLTGVQQQDSESTMDLMEGSIIRCQKTIETDDLQWIVNGVLIAVTCKSMRFGEIHFGNRKHGPCLRLGWCMPENCETVPCVLVASGECRFATIELES